VALIWTDWNNGDSNLLLRTGLNSFNNSTVTDVNKNTTDIATVDAKVAINAGDITTLEGRATVNEADIVVLENPISTKYVPQAIAPGHVEGQVFYNSVTGTHDVQGAYPDVTLQTGREQHMEVLNNTLDIIVNGAICTQSGVTAGIPTIKLALADTFDNARILGIATHSIGVGETGIITTFGEINGLNTFGVTTGVPVYLSDTTPGGFVETPPNIISRVGGVIIADASNGKLFAYIINNKNLPSVFGGLQGQTTPLYSLTATAQDIVGYTIIKEVVVTVDALTGEITTPNEGEYRMNFSASIAFSALATTRSITIEYYDVTNTAIHFSYVKNIPRDAVEDGLSFSFPIDALSLDVSKLRIKSSVAIDVTFTAISFDIESINLR